MVEERDFTNCKELRKGYEGASGGKKCLVIDGEPYMVKFPAASKRNPNISYTNSCISEYLGCHVFDSVGIPVQKTMLGTYTTQEGRRKVVVACKDMTRPGVVLQSFIAMKNQAVDSSGEGTGTELANIEEAFQKQTLFDQKVLVERFWDMFIVDALIGNFDRHNGNWGCLYDSTYDTVELAPVFDCGSCLFPQADEDVMKQVLVDEEALLFRVFSIPGSAIRIEGRKISYPEFIGSLSNRDCNNALKRIYPRMDIEVLCRIVRDTPYITSLQKDFYQLVLRARHRLILSKAYEKLMERESVQRNPRKDGKDGKDYWRGR